jgi:REP element-mobilizing transposase RayT
MLSRKKRKNSLRLKNYDYSLSGAYFVTISSCKQREIFGQIDNGKMFLSEIGKVANDCWLRIPQHFPMISIDEYVVMPNHVHGIIIIGDSNPVGAENFPPLRLDDGLPRPLGNIIRGFKIGVTKWARKNTTINTVWQRSFHDHIVRNDLELERIRTYIRNNPLKWHLDRQNSDCMQEEAAGYMVEDWMV